MQTYGLKNPNRTGVILGNSSITAAEALASMLKFVSTQEVVGPERAWLKRIVRYGVTLSLIKELNEAMLPLKQVAVPVLDSAGRGLSWGVEPEDAIEFMKDRGKFFQRLTEDTLYDIWEMRKRVEKGEVDIDSEHAQRFFAEVSDWVRGAEDEWNAIYIAIWAHSVAYFVADGVMENLRLCMRPECKKFFIGGPRAKWCSSNCGGIVRTKRKRKLDKERQVL